MRSCLLVVVYLAEGSERKKKMQRLRTLRAAELAKVAEYADRENFLTKTFKKTWPVARIDQMGQQFADKKWDVAQFKKVMEGNLLTYLLHWYDDLVIRFDVRTCSSFLNHLLD